MFDTLNPKPQKMRRLKSDTTIGPCGGLHLLSTLKGGGFRVWGSGFRAQGLGTTGLGLQGFKALGFLF